MITVKVAANITYSGFTYDTPLILEYEHTGKQWFYKKGKKECYTENPFIANDRIKQGVKVTEKQGYYFIKRMAIVSGNDIWYITNPGDSYRVNKFSKYAKKIHAELSKEQPPINQP